MPIYEFYCKKCHMIFNFFSVSVNVEKTPDCPKCKKTGLERQISKFATLKKREDGSEMPLPDMDESKIEQAMNMLAGEADKLDENDPKQAAGLMRKLSDMTGLNPGPGMEEALSRMERGEDPVQIEAEMGDLLESEDPFPFKEKRYKVLRERPPRVDEELYYL